MSSGRYMAYSPSPSPHIACLRSTATAIVEQQEGHGSIKDPAKEEMMRGKPGFEHLNEPLHIHIVEAELPVDIIDARLMQAREILEDLLRPVDKTHDFYKKQQLRELAMLKGTLREETVQMSGSVSPFNNNSLGMKRAKTTG